MARLSILVPLAASIALSAPVDARPSARQARIVQIIDFSQQPPHEAARFELTASLASGDARRIMLRAFLANAGTADQAVRTARESQAYAPTRAGPVFGRLGTARDVSMPGWLRPAIWGRAAPAPFGSPAPADNCSPRGYTASGLLRVTGEERRRLLYPLVASYACRYGLPIGLFDAMIIQESGYNALIRSPRGAFGLGQLMPETAMQLGVDPYNLRGNLDGAARFLAAQLREFNDPHLALAAYNSGPARVRKLQRVPRIPETLDYVHQVMTNWRTLEFRGTVRR